VSDGATTLNATQQALLDCCDGKRDHAHGFGVKRHLGVSGLRLTN
jgi:hypothetical protein